MSALTRGYTVSAAAEMTGFARRTWYVHRDNDPEFAAAWDEACDQGADYLEDEARRRAVDGTDKPVYHQGQMVGTIREYSDTLLIFLLKGRRPERFRDNFKVEVSGQIEIADQLREKRRAVDDALKAQLGR